MFEGQPKGLWALALANTGERLFFVNVEDARQYQNAENGDPKRNVDYQ